MGKLIENPTKIGDIGTSDVRGPWKTKSGGVLNVLFALPEILREEFFKYDEEELEAIPVDIRGLRVYTVRDLPEGGAGGGEFHRIRTEIVICLEGQILWECEDLFRHRMIVTLTPEKNIIYMPPFILHTYKVEAESSSLLVVANTLFFPDPRTHDTFPIEDFRNLQKRYK